MEYQYFEGHKAEKGEKLIAAILFCAPWLGALKTMALPRARRALKGFRKMAPNSSRFPLPWEWTAG
eukprot:5585982-Karenia_brevis.AAC.1